MCRVFECNANCTERSSKVFNTSLKYKFLEGTSIPVEKHLFEVQRNLLRSEEGENLTAKQKGELSEVLVNNIDVFSEGQ